MTFSTSGASAESEILTLPSTDIFEFLLFTLVKCWLCLATNSLFETIFFTCLYNPINALTLIILVNNNLPLVCSPLFIISIGDFLEFFPISRMLFSFLPNWTVLVFSSANSSIFTERLFTCKSFPISPISLLAFDNSAIWEFSSLLSGLNFAKSHPEIFLCALDFFLAPSSKSVISFAHFLPSLTQLSYVVFSKKYSCFCAGVKFSIPISSNSLSLSSDSVACSL